MSVSVSVIVPVYNKSKYIERCAKSLKAQIFADFEAIFVDDGSTDDSFYICNEICDNDSRFRVIKQENAGVAAARNTGIKSAYGKYITFMDPDDTVKNNFLSELLETAETENAQITCCGYSVISGGEYSHEFIPHNGESKRDILIGLIRESPYYNSMWSKLYLREFITLNDIFLPHGIIIGEDALFNLHAYEKAEKTAIVGRALYNYHINPGSAMNTKNDRINRLIFIKQRCENAKRLDLLNETCADLAEQIFKENGNICEILGKVSLNDKVLQFEINTGTYSPIRRIKLFLNRMKANIRKTIGRK